MQIMLEGFENVLDPREISGKQKEWCKGHILPCDEVALCCQSNSIELGPRGVSLLMAWSSHHNCQKSLVQETRKEKRLLYPAQ